MHFMRMFCHTRNYYSNTIAENVKEIYHKTDCYITKLIATLQLSETERMFVFDITLIHYYSTSGSKMLNVAIWKILHEKRQMMKEKI